MDIEILLTSSVTMVSFQRECPIDIKILLTSSVTMVSERVSDGQ